MITPRKIAAGTQRRVGPIAFDRAEGQFIEFAISLLRALTAARLGVSL